MTRIRPFRLALDEDEESAVLAVLQSGEVAAGPDIELFERELARAIGAGGAAAVSSGFAALHLALLALEVGTGDEVIMPCVSTCAAIRDATRAAGAIPVFADTNRTDFNLDPRRVEEKITSRTRAIVAPHHTGIPARIGALNELGLPVIEDCAQAFGGTAGGKPLGSLSTASVFSFYATKLMTTIDGGAVASSRQELVERVRDLRYYGGCWDATPRFNYKMQNLGASLGRVQLRKLPSRIARRRMIGETFRAAILDAGAPDTAILQASPDDIYFRFALRVPRARRSAVREWLEGAGISCRVEAGFLTPEITAYPAAERLAGEVLSLPAYPALADDEIARIAEALHGVMREQRSQEWVFDA